VPLQNPGGRLSLPRVPGLGVEFDMDYLRANAVDGFGG
jgi:galactonate dehydratase